MLRLYTLDELVAHLVPEDGSDDPLAVGIQIGVIMALGDSAFYACSEPESDGEEQLVELLGLVHSHGLYHRIDEGREVLSESLVVKLGDNPYVGPGFFDVVVLTWSDEGGSVSQYFVCPVEAMP